MCIRDSPLPLAEGEVVCYPLSETAHPDGLEGFVGPMRDLLGAQPQVRRAEGDVLVHSGEEQLVVGVLEDHAHAASHLAEGGVLDGGAEHPDHTLAPEYAVQVEQ